MSEISRFIGTSTSASTPLLDLLFTSPCHSMHSHGKKLVQAFRQAAGLSGAAETVSQVATSLKLDLAVAPCAAAPRQDAIGSSYVRHVQASNRHPWELELGPWPPSPASLHDASSTFSAGERAGGELQVAAVFLIGCYWPGSEDGGAM
jgi:hypothetical protein